jgi:hypothetical protein
VRSVMNQLRQRWRLASLRRRLRRLQREYLAADAKSDELIVSYLATLREARDCYVALSPPPPRARSCTWARGTITSRAGSMSTSSFPRCVTSSPI